MKKTILFLSLISITLLGFSQVKSDRFMPISTQWTIDATDSIERMSIPNTFLIRCHESKGTGFQLKSGVIITCAHVIKKSSAKEISCSNAYGNIYFLNRVVTDTLRDLAILFPNIKLSGGLSLGNEDLIKIGKIVNTWGFPLGHNGPSPILSVGYISGFKNYQSYIGKNDTIKHLVVNGAFNPGNSGGPLFMDNSNKVIGIVVSKMNPLLSNLELSAIRALGENSSGVTFTYTHGDGKTEQLVESQLVAYLLNTYKNLTQVMIGEAISISVLKQFLKENNVDF